MKWDLKTPCDDCPFRVVGGIRLGESRIREIADGMLDSQGITFACHKTTMHDDEGDPVPNRKERHCAGALIFAEKHGTATQMMRIAERLGTYDHTKLDETSRAEVWDSKKEWLKNGAI